MTAAPECLNASTAKPQPGIIFHGGTRLVVAIAAQAVGNSSELFPGSGSYIVNAFRCIGVDYSYKQCTSQFVSGLYFSGLDE